MTKTNRYDSNAMFVPANDPLDIPLGPPRSAPEALQASASDHIVPVTIDAGGKGVAGQNPQDAARALLVRFAVVAAVLFTTTGGMFIFAVLKTPVGAGDAIPAWIVVSGAMSLLAWMAMDRSDKQHSPAGTERHRADKASKTAITTNRDQVQAWRDVEITRWTRHYDSIENQQRLDADERQHLLDERRRLNG